MGARQAKSNRSTRPQPFVLIVHGPSGRRQRNRVPSDRRVLLGRATGSAEFDRDKLLVDVDHSVSRLQAWLQAGDGVLEVERHDQSRAPLTFQGNASDRFTLKPGEFFQVGQSTICFELVTDPDALPKQDLEGSDESAPFEYTVTQGAAGVRPAAAAANRWLATLIELPRLLQEFEAPGPFLTAVCARLQTAFGHRARISAWEVLLPDDVRESATVRSLDSNRTESRGDAHQPSRRATRAAFHHPDEAIVKVWPTGLREQDSEFSAPGAEVAWTMYLPIQLPESERYLIYAEGRGGQTMPVDRGQLSDARQILGLVAGIAREHLIAAQADRWRGQMGQFFSPRLRELVLKGSGDASGQGARSDPLARVTCDATILFFDLRGFSRATEDIDPSKSGSGDAGEDDAVMQRVDAYYDVLERVMGTVAACVFAEDGIILQYEGDAALACWGAPTAQADHQLRAVRAAQRIVEKIYAMDMPFAMDAGRNAPLRCGVGIATGRVVAGRFVARLAAAESSDAGASGGMVTYTVMGTVVNQAARLEGLTKHIRVPILTSFRVEQIPMRWVARVIPAGMRQTVDLYEPVTPVEVGGSGASDESIRHYETALQAFLAGELDNAAAELRDPSISAYDPVQEFLTGYILTHRRTGLPSNWDGIIRFDTK